MLIPNLDPYTILFYWMQGLKENLNNTIIYEIHVTLDFYYYDSSELWNFFFTVFTFLWLIC